VFVAASAGYRGFSAQRRLFNEYRGHVWRWFTRTERLRFTVGTCWRCVGIELNPEYIELAKRRIQQEVLF
jgi:hypothetical protein